MDSPDFRALSLEQQTAACAPDGPLLIIAGPGAGKTRTLAARIAHLITTRGVPPGAILALTFATTATDELRARLLAWTGSSGAQVAALTFHAWGLQVIADWHRALGYTTGPPRVLDTTTARAIAHEVLPSHSYLDASGSLTDPYRLISNYRLGDRRHSPELLAPLVTAYEARLRYLGVIDFPSMLTLTLRLFAEHPAALRHYQTRYRYVLVDEVQDVCPVQAALLRWLVPANGNLTVVGDPAQCLYGWRGADGTFLRDFTHHYPAARLVRLTENYRSTGRIVAVANALCADLPHGQRLTTPNPAGPAVRLTLARDEPGEAAFIASEAIRLLTSGAVERPGEIAVLARTNRQLATLAPLLRQHGLPTNRPPESATADRVTLTTIHGAKGREWAAVFVTGCEEGLLPHCRATDPAALTGEHHAAFVAVTRPRDRLYLTACRQRADPQQTVRPTAPSRYLTTLRAAGLIETTPRAA